MCVSVRVCVRVSVPQAQSAEPSLLFPSHLRAQPGHFLCLPAAPGSKTSPLPCFDGVLFPILVWKGILKPLSILQTLLFLDCRGREAELGSGWVGFGCGQGITGLVVILRRFVTRSIKK